MPGADAWPAQPDAIPWLALDASGRVAAVVYATDAVAAMRELPAGTSLYVGGPSPQHPQRPWWTDNWPREPVSAERRGAVARA